MIVLKNNPVGIDFSIQKLQMRLYSELAKLWVNEDKPIVHHSFGRCYRNRVGNNYKAELYTSNDEYIDVYYNDDADVVSFFGTGDTIADNTQAKANIHLIMFCNLSRIKPSVAHRADEESRVDVIGVIGKALYGFHLESVQTGLQAVLKEYKGSWETLGSVDFGSIHSFRLNFSLNYNPKQSIIKLS